MENTNKTIQEQPQEIRGWADVELSTQMPLNALVHFLNILNQRVALLEDEVVVSTPEGKKMTVTEVYRERAKQEALMAQQAQNQPTESAE